MTSKDILDPINRIQEMTKGCQDRSVGKVSASKPYSLLQFQIHVV